MIEFVHKLCEVWAKEVGVSRRTGDSVLGRLIDGIPSCNGLGATIPLSLESEEIDAIISGLWGELKSVVYQRYLGKGNSIENAKALKMSKEKFYNLLHVAHVEIAKKLEKNKN